VTNRCLDFLRTRRRHVETAYLKACGQGSESEVLRRAADNRHVSNPESNLAARETRSRITGALGKLSPCERTVFELRHYHDMTLRTVALMLDMSEANTRHALFRARQKLRTALAEVR